MHEVAQSYARVLGFALIVLLLTACGSAGDFSESETAPQPALRSGADSPVDSKEAAIAAVRTHLSEIISCREAHGRLEQDFSQGMFEARLASAYSLRTQNPVWEVAFVRRPPYPVRHLVCGAERRHSAGEHQRGDVLRIPAPSHVPPRLSCNSVLTEIDPRQGEKRGYCAVCRTVASASGSVNAPR